MNKENKTRMVLELSDTEIQSILYCIRAGEDEINETFHKELCKAIRNKIMDAYANGVHTELRGTKLDANKELEYKNKLKITEFQKKHLK